MNQQASPTPDDSGPRWPRPASAVEDAAAALRLPGPLGRPRVGLPVAPGAPLIPTALSAFNRLTGRLDQGGPAGADQDNGVVVTELSGTPVEPVRPTVRDRRA
jgi:hypothetical protein